MMKRDYYFLYIILSLGLLVPVPGRFAYGFVLILLLNILLFAGLFVKRLVRILDIEEFQSVIIATALISICILYKQFIILLSPIMALTLGFAIFIPAVSSFLLGYVGDPVRIPLKEECYDCMKKAGRFSVYGLFFFIIRDVLGYGTITFPKHNGIFQIRFFNVGAGYIGSFFASIPGALVLTAVFVIFLNHVKNKFEIVQMTKDINSEIKAQSEGEEK